MRADAEAESPRRVTLGYKSTLKTYERSPHGWLRAVLMQRSLRNGRAKLVIISGNTPPLRKSELEYYAMLAKVRRLPPGCLPPPRAPQLTRRRPRSTTSKATMYVSGPRTPLSRLVGRPKTLRSRAHAPRARPALRRGLAQASEGGALLTRARLQIELGTACGKLFRCSTMAILEAGALCLPTAWSRSGR